MRGGGELGYRVGVRPVAASGETGRACRLGHMGVRTCDLGRKAGFGREEGFGGFGCLVGWARFWAG